MGLPRLVLGRLSEAVAPRIRSVVVEEGVVHGSARREKLIFHGVRLAPKSVTHLEVLSRDFHLKLTKRLRCGGRDG